MSASVLLLQFALAILLFFLTNWIGKHSISFGYMQLSLFVKSDEAPAFNLVIRILTPVVYVIVVTTILYQLGLDSFTSEIHLVVLYYFGLRLLFNMLAGRTRLLNWRTQLLHVSITYALAYFVYDKILRVKANILPDFSTISNELWIIVLIFIYELFNELKFSDERSKRRKSNYLHHRYYLYKGMYQPVIEELTTNQKLQALIYTIMIYEAFNRPKAYRIVETILFPLGISKTLGIMQIKTEHHVSDSESVRLGAQKILADVSSAATEAMDRYGHSDRLEWYVLDGSISRYNAGSQYRSEILRLFGFVRDVFYSDTKDRLIDGPFPSTQAASTSPVTGGR